MQSSLDDARLCWKNYSQNGFFIFDCATDTLREVLAATYGIGNYNEPHLDRHQGRYVQAGGAYTYPETHGGACYDWDIYDVLWQNTDSGIDSHRLGHHTTASGRYVFTMDEDKNAPDYVYYIDLAGSGGEPTQLTHPAVGGGTYVNGNWNEQCRSGDPDDIYSMLSCTVPGGPDNNYSADWLSDGGFVLINANDDARLIGHPYNNDGDPDTRYFYATWQKLSPDGLFMRFMSNMNKTLGNENAIFMAEMPTT